MPQAPTVELPKQLPLVIVPENRGDSTSKDAKLVNCYSEKTAEGEYWIYKRPGLLQSSQPPGGAAAGRGMWNWLGDVYSIFADKLYKNGVAIAGTVDTTNGVYKWASCLGATPKLQLGNGVKAYNYDAAGGLVQITDGDFPAAFVKGWCYLDATTYVGTAAATIQGSDINDPTAWDPLNVLTAQIESDAGMAMAKQLVYVVFFKQWSTEIFYDAANASGSPLGTVQGAKVNFGTVSSDSVIDVDGMLFWIAVNKSSSVQVMKMEGLKAQIVSTDPIERLLNNSDFSTVYSMSFKNGSHRFCLWTIVEENLTVVYDIDTQMWAQWTDVDGNYFPFVATTYSSTTEQLFQHESNGRIYVASDSYVNDNGSVITLDIVTPNFDGGTKRRKNMTVMKFVADQVAGSTMYVRKNDDDYDPTKWSNFRKVDLSQKQPMLANCGTFVRRAHQLRHQSNTSFRIKAVEMQLDLGTL